MKKFIQKALNPAHKGAFTAWCKRNGFKSVTAACIAKAKGVASKTGNKTLMGQANFAERANRKGGF